MYECLRDAEGAFYYLARSVQKDMKINIVDDFGEAGREHFNYYWFILALGANLRVIQNQERNNFELIYSRLVNHMEEHFGDKEQSEAVIKEVIVVCESMSALRDPKGFPNGYYRDVFPNLFKVDYYPILLVHISAYFVKSSSIWDDITAQNQIDWKEQRPVRKFLDGLFDKGAYIVSFIVVALIISFLFKGEGFGTSGPEESDPSYESEIAAETDDYYVSDMTYNFVVNNGDHLAQLILDRLGKDIDEASLEEIYYAIYLTLVNDYGYFDYDSSIIAEELSLYIYNDLWGE